MARIRSIKPEFWADEKLAHDLVREQRLFYVGLWNEADDEGRFIANARKLLGSLFAFDEDLHEEFIENSLRRLAETRRVVLYVVEGCRYGQLTKFRDHQRINRPSPSKFPAPPLGSEPLTDDSVRPHTYIDEASPPEQVAGSRETEQGAGSVGVAHTREGSQNGEQPQAPPDYLTTWLGDQATALPDWPPLRDHLVRQALFADYAQGMRAGAWNRPDGTAAPEADRPRLLTTALRSYAAEGKRVLVGNEFGGALRALIRSETQASAPPGTAHTPHAAEPVSVEARALTEQIKHRTGRKVLELDQAAAAERAAEDAARAWIDQQDPETQARALLKIKSKFQGFGREMPTKPDHWMLRKVALQVANELRAERSETAVA